MTPKTKIFYNGRRLNGRFDSLRMKLQRAVRVLKVGVVAIIVGALLVGTGAIFFSTSTVTASTETIVQTPASPVLDRIADCESGNGLANTGTQFGKSGQVLMKPNTNGTVDVGKYQINSVWFAQATKLGYDITTLQGNKAMAEWIYANKGTGDWSASAHCWNK